jgi:DNA invertase Pin-like site-specific DNA recombinase
VIAKLDRLARNVAFVSALMDSGIEFVACDMPQANRLTVHILAAVAEDEARRISERTKDALAVLKQKGALLGSSRPNHWLGRTKDGESLRSERREVGLAKARRASAKTRTADAIEYARRLKQQIDALGEGLTYEQIAARLNEQGLVSPRGARITKGLISKVMSRIACTTEPS